MTKNLHYFDLREIRCETDVEVICLCEANDLIVVQVAFEFEIKKSKTKVSMVFQTAEAPRMVSFFLEQYARITNGFTLDKKCRMRVQEK